jgi:mRNA-degrading endonuclease RelE of RelBE toxin-antitoxin system
VLAVTHGIRLFTGFRLRCGDHRVFFDVKGKNIIEITAVRNRRDAYR